MKKIGIYTAYDPKVELKQHGLGRLLSALIKGMVDSGYVPVIAVPSWHVDCMTKFLRENNLDKDVKLLYTSKASPIILQMADIVPVLMSRFSHKRVKTGFMSSLVLDIFYPRLDHAKRHKIKEAIDNFFLSVKNLPYTFFCSVIATNSWFLAFIYGLIFLVFLLFYFIWSIIYTLLSLLFRILKTPLLLVKKLVGGGQFGNILSNISLQNFKALKFYPFVQKVRNAYRHNELPALIRKINTSDIDKWIVPTIFWSESIYIKKPKVTVVPDIVYLSFPMHMCSEYCINLRIPIIDKIIKGSNNFVTYSKFVKEEQLMKYYAIDSRRIHTIPHAAMKFDEYIKPELLPAIFDSLKCGAYKHLAQYDFNEMDFIIYPSQLRPYKNITTLIKACKILITQKQCNIKLVLTLNQQERIIDFIRENNMTSNVIFASDLSNAQLAALNHAANLSVNPSLFEGGFPFTFTEAYSTGTPSIMARIPAADEVISGELADIMLFDPYDLDDMARKIHWGLKHCDELFSIQKELYDRVNGRSWKDVAKEYISSI